VHLELRERFASGDQILMASGTAALALALCGAREENPGPTALPSYCCYDIATAANTAEIPAILYDIDPVSLAPDLDSLEEALSAGATSVVVAHLFGMPADMAPIEQLTRAHGALLIDDAAQAFGASVKDRPAGALGTLGILSFNRGKGVTGGMGGALLGFGSEGSRILAALADRVESAPPGGKALLSCLGQWMLGRPSLYGLPRALPFLRMGETVYKHPTPMRALPDASAGVLRHTLALAEGEVGTRCRNAARLLDTLLDGTAIQTIDPLPGCSPSYLRLPVLLRGSARQKAASASARRLGVVAGYPRPLNRLPQLATRALNASRPFHGAEQLVEELHTLPTHGRLGGRDVAALSEWARTVGG
jgi:dTDP-4-amino-4,6-dideoxygalactose transaminase